MSYIECPQCGQRALSIATRCPRCGHEFPRDSLHQRVSKPSPGNLGPVLRSAGALAAAVVLVALVRLSSRLVTGSPVEAPLHTEPSVTSQLSRSAFDSSPSAEQPSVGGQLLRYATTWVNVRETRSRHAPVAYVLDPGEPVMLDSLILGWYRVVVDGQVLGYAARPYFETSPPLDRP